MRDHFLKRIICFAAVFMMLTVFLPVQTFAANGKQPPSLPYEKVIYKNGSWVSFVSDAGGLIVGYDGKYEIEEELFIDDQTGENISHLPPAEFRINKDQVLSGIYLPYIYYPLSPDQPAAIGPVYVQLEDNRGNLYGPYGMEGKKVLTDIDRRDSTTEEIEQRADQSDEPRAGSLRPAQYMYSFIPEGEIRLPQGSYTVHTSDPANLVRTQSSGLQGTVFIKGYEGAPYEKYKKELLLWNMKNNPELFGNETIIREVVDGEAIEGEAATEEYTVLGNMELFNYREEKNEAKEYFAQEREEYLPAQFPLYLSLPAPALIDEIAFNTYNDGLGAPPGTVSIIGVDNGEDFGTFQASGTTLQGVPNGMWIVSPGITLPAGEYMIDVSDESVVSSFGDGRPDFYIGATPPPPVDHDFSGTYLIDVTTQKTGSVGIGVQTGESKDTFSLSSHPVTILDRGDHILVIGSYEGITVSQRCAVGSRTPNSFQTTLEISMDLSGTPAKTNIAAAVNISMSKPVQGAAALTIGGSATYAREATKEEGGDFNTYQVAGNGVFSGKDLSPAVIPFMGLGMASAGSIPGPDGPGQAAVGVLFPPLATLLAGILENILRRKKLDDLYEGDSPEIYDFGDGRKYQEGGTYTFDDGREYTVRNGEFEFVRQLGEGDSYTNPDGDKKVWVGGQSWQASDWQTQDATNREYAQAHEQDWEKARSSPDSYMQDAFADIKEHEEAYENLGRMQQAAWRNDMASIGEADDMYTRINEIMDDMDSGKPADHEKIRKIRDYMGNRLQGNTMPDSKLPDREKLGGWFDLGLWNESLTETGRNLSGLPSEDGSLSWKGLGGRIGIGILSGGTSEWVMAPMGAGYVMEDAVRQGASDLGAFGSAVAHVVKGEAIGRTFGGILNTLGGAGSSGLKHVVGGGKLDKTLLGALSSGGKKGFSSWAGGQMNQLKDVMSSQAWTNTANRLTGNITSGVSRIDNILSGKEGLSLPKSAQPASAGAFTPAAEPQPISAIEHKKLEQLNEALKSGDPDKLAEVYAKGGMKQLSELQQKGHISQGMARRSNELLTHKLKEVIREGTHDSIKQTQRQTGVRIEELIVGDSGSGAKKAVTRIMTDADRTLIPRFNEADLQRFAGANKMTRAQAYDALSKQLQKSHISSVGDSLKRSGLSADDVGFSSYDRIGSASGQADSYGSRFTNVRQAGAGTAQVYTPDGKGGFKVHSTSGQAAVDQNLLNKQTYGTGTIPPDPVKLLPRDVPSIIKQQAGSVMNNSGDPLTVAKALGRADKVSQIIKNNGILPVSMSDTNGNLVRMANDIYANPGSINTVLRNNGMTLEQFLKQSKDVLTGYDRTLSGVRIQ